MNEFLKHVLGEIKSQRLAKDQGMALIERFQRETRAQGAALHPLLQRNTSTLAGQRFSTTFSGQEFFFADHVVQGRAILPGVAYLEMARAAVAASTGAQQVVLKNVVWVQPIAIEGAQVDVHIALYQQDDGAIGFEVSSGAEGGEPVVHSQGLALIDSGAQARPIALDGWLPAGDVQVQHTDDSYAWYRRAGLDYGAGFQSIERIESAAGRMRVKLRLPAAVAATQGQHLLHPSMMDGALQASVTFMLDALRNPASVGSALPVPFALQELQVLKPCTADMWALLQYHPGSAAGDKVEKLDIDLCDAAGEVCVRMVGFSSRRIEAKTVDAAQAGIGSLLVQPAWRVQAVGGPARVPAGTAHQVLLLGIAGISAEALAVQLPGAQCRALPQQQQDIAVYYEACALALLQTLQQAALHRPAEGLLLQVVVPANGPQQLLAGLAGLLKSAQCENPQWFMQLLQLADDADATGLASRLTSEMSGQLDAEVLHRGQQRAVKAWDSVPAEGPRAQPWKDGGVYLITGGAGGLGLLFAREIARSTSAPVLVLCGRSAATPATEAALQSLQALGARAVYRVADVCERAAVQALVAEIDADFGGLNGIVHAAGLNRDAFIVKKTADELQSVLSAKVSGLVNLDEVTQALPLDCLILFASRAGAEGNVGQADYAAGNAFMDAFAARRNALRAQGRRQGHTLSLDWPLWQAGGMQIAPALEAQRQEQSGMVALRTETGIAALYRAWGEGCDQAMVLEGDLDRLQQRLGLCLGDALEVDEPADAPQASAAAAPVAPGQAAQLRERAIDYFRKLLSTVLKMPAQRIEAAAPMERYGIDSIMVMRLTNQLETVFGSLSKTLFFEYHTLAELSGYFVEAHRERMLNLLGLDAAPAAATVAQAAAASSGAASRTAARRGRQPAVIAAAAKATATAAAQAQQACQDIAIIGLSGRYPQARNLQAFWENLKAGRDCITEVPAERWDHSLYFDTDKNLPGKAYTKWGGFIDGVDEFDPLFFNIAPRSAANMDPQSRLFLQCAYEALEDAGYTRETIAQRKNLGLPGQVGVYVAVMYAEYQFYGAQSQLVGEAPYAVSGSASSVANRVSYFCNFHGPSMAVDTMCSASLTALHLACESLRKGEVDVAIAGGVNVSIHPNKYVYLSQNKFVSSKGRCESFGEGGEGYVPAEGVGAVLLKPLDRAIADGDVIHGVIRATAINHGGHVNGYTVPNPNAQHQVIELALQRAGLAAHDISYVESHGTGTSLGDPIEIAGLNKTFLRDTQQKQFCAIGSVKSNIGHAESAAGMAGLAKVLLQMKHGQLAPSLHSARLNPHIDFANSAFVVQQELAEWTRPTRQVNGRTVTLPRIAGLSSFGAGGSNAHVVVQEYIAPAATQQASMISADRPALFLLSAKTAASLDAQIARWVHELAAGRFADADLADIAYTLQIGREAMDERLALTASSIAELQQKLQAVAQGDLSAEGVYRGQLRQGQGQDMVALFSSDDDLAQAVASWIAKAKHGQLLELWAKGLNVDWAALYGDQKPRRISLPTYAFARERHWLPAGKPLAALPQAGAASLHPLLHANTSTLEAQRYSASFRGDEFFLADHRVKGRRVLPGAASLEMARAAAVLASGEEAVSLKNIVWLRPVLVGDEPQALDIALDADDEGGLGYQIYSEGEGDQEARVYSQGDIVLGSERPRTLLDIGSTLQQCATRLTAEQVYQACDAKGLNYGPAHRSIESLHVGEGQALAQLVLPAAVAQTLDSFLLHPSLLDGALQASLGLALNETQAALPFALDELQILGRCSARMWAHLRHAAGHTAAVRQLDIDLYDDTGLLCARLIGFTSRVLEKVLDKVLDKAGDQAAGTLLLAKRWQARTACQAMGSGEHIVLVADALADALAIDHHALAPVLPGARISPLAGVGYAGQAAALFAQVQALLKSKPAAPVGLQVIVPANQPEMRGLAGLLKTARLENPLLQGQLIEVDDTVDAPTLATLATLLKADAGAAQDIEIRHQQGERLVADWAEIEAIAHDQPWKDGGVYLITGGAGGLGRIFATEIAQQTQGATLVLTGRSPLDAGKQAFLDELQALGATASYRAIDVEDADAVAGLVDGIADAHGRLHGIVHSAGVNRDNFIIRKSAEEFAQVLAAKVSGLQNLEAASRELALDFIILFSSKSGAVGNAGQADYAAGNAFMDAFAQQRNVLAAQGLRSGRTLAMNWPLWAEGGMRMDAAAQARKARETGAVALGTTAGIQALYAAWASGEAQVLVLEGDVQRLRDSVLGTAAAAPADSGVPVIATAAAAAPTDAAMPAQRPAQEAQASQDALQDKATQYFKKLLSGVLGLSAQRIEPDAAMETYGIDSVMVMQLTAQLETSFGKLPKTLFFEYQTLAALVGYFLRSHRGQLVSLLGLNTPSAPVVAAVPAAVPALAPAAQPAMPSARAPRRGRFGKTRLASESITHEKRGSDIAIIGLAGRYPQARTVAEFWENLKAGRDSVTEVPSERWDHSVWFDADKTIPGKTYTKWGGFIDGVDEFDPLFFNISPREAEAIDPQVRLFLQTVYEAIEDAGYTRDTLAPRAEGPGGEVGVYVGVMYQEYQHYGVQSQQKQQQQSGAVRPFAVSGCSASVANRVSFCLNFHGPSIALDTMCSSSLTAIHLACESLRQGSCEVAVAGGVNLSIHPNKYLLLGQGKFVSSKGLCESFGEGGEGYVPAEGVGAVILKPLHKAIEDGDQIHGVIKATSLNHGGRVNGYTVPSPAAQAEVVSRALALAGVPARAVSYVEAHGTGTSLGDPIEVAGLAKAYGAQTQDRQFCAIGSAKSNIGHTESAAGIAGLTKLLLQMRHGQIAPSLHSARLNPHIDFANSPFVVQQQLADWTRPVLEIDGRSIEYPRIAGLSSFGAGGANAHLLVQEHVAAARPTVAVDAQHPALVLLSARSEVQLQQQVARLLALLRSEAGQALNIADVAYTLQVGREAMEERLGLIVSGHDDLAGKLQAFIDGEDGIEDLYRGQVRQNRDALAPFVSDEDMAQTLASWTAKGKHGKLLSLWVKGLALDWHALHGEHKPRRISLPAYPFAQERYWVPVAQASSSAAASLNPQLHPLLHANVSTLDAQCYRTQFSGSEFFLADHRIQGQRVLPGAASLEMARAAAALASGASDAGAMSLRNIVWLRPVVAEPAQPLQVVLQPDDEGGLGFEICSEDGGETLVHSQGELLLDVALPRTSVDIDALLAACDTRLEAPQVYAAYEAKGLHYGPAHRAIEALHCGPGQVLAQLALPAALLPTLQAYVLHPSLLDGALQAGIGLSLGDSRAALPFALNELQVLAPCTARMWAHLRHAPGHGAALRQLDIDLYDEQGLLCARLLGFMARVLAKSGESAASPDTAAEDLQQPVATLLMAKRWIAQPATAGAAAAQQLLLLAGLPALDSAALQASLPGVSVQRLAGAAYAEQAAHLFAQVQVLLKNKPAAPVLLQVVVPASQPVTRGLAGLLKTARLENPLLLGQLIEVDEAIDAATLATLLRADAGAAQDIEIRHAQGERFVAEWAEVEATAHGQPWKDGGVYLITGGAGGLGRIFAKEIAQQTQGATLILTGRSAIDADKQAFVAELQALGATASYRAIDVEDAHAVAGLIDGIADAHGALNGIVHSAGVNRDNFIIRKSAEEFARVLAVKVSGLQNLEAASRGQALDFMILFSSKSGALGNPGQADYSAGNAFMDAFAQQQRHQAGHIGRTLSVNWPLWAEGGMRMDAAAQARMARDSGSVALATEAGIQALYAAWSGGEAQVMVLAGDVQRMRQSVQRPQAAAVLATSAAVPAALPLAVAAAAPTVAPVAAPVATAATSGADGLREKTAEHLKKLLSAVLNLPAQRIDSDAAMEAYGIDSVMVMQLTAQLETSFGKLPKTLFFEYQSIDALAAYFVRSHHDALVALLGLAAPAAAAAAQPVAATSVASMAGTSRLPSPAAPRLIRTGARGASRARLARNEPAAPAAASHTDIAIIGFSGRYPQASNLQQYWDNLKAGRDCITEVPAERWDHARYFDAAQGEAGKTYSRWGGFIDGIDRFDPLFFGISPRDAERMDPQERLLLEQAHASLEDAGYTAENLSGNRKVGVFVGVMNGYYGSGVRFWSAANRISYLMNFQGPSLAVDTACSSSLTALHLACESLHSGSCDSALVGGVNLIIDPLHLVRLCAAGMLSPTGRSKSFGDGADGFVDAEGVGMLVLKPLQRAIEDGDAIHGVIKGTMINAGGKVNGFMVPNPAAQARVIADALQRAGVDARSISYVEAHGTGTALGDPIEIAGLTQAFQRDTTDLAYCTIGSAKSNIGHCESAAGVAGISKVLLQMKHRQLVPSLHIARRSPHIDFDGTPFVLRSELADWARPEVLINGRPEQMPRRAGISSFGAGGANAHVVIEEFDPLPPAASTITPQRPALIVLSARNEDRLIERARRLLAAIDTQGLGDDQLPSLAWTLQVGREAMEERLGFTAASMAELCLQLSAFIEQGAQAQDLHRGRVQRRSSTLGLFGADEDMRAALDQGMSQWLAKGKFDKLLSLWVQGLAIDWQALQGDVKPRRISLPSYPFAEERYWLAQTDGSVMAERAGIVNAMAAQAAAPVQRPTQRVLQFLRKQWLSAADAATLPLPQRALILANAATADLARELAASLVGSQVLRADDAASAAASFDGADAFIDLLGCDAHAGEIALIGITPLQLWLAARRQHGGQALAVSRGFDDSSRASLYRLLGSEYNRLASRHLALAPATDETSAVAQILRELQAAPDAAEARYHHGQRQQAALQPVSLPEGESQDLRFTPDQVLLVTGGTRGIGLLCARHFVQQQGVRQLVLMGRDALPARAQWQALSQAGDAQAHKLRELLALEALGVRLTVLNTPLDDAAALQAALEEVAQQQGPIAGLLHAAGLVDLETPAFIHKTPASMQRVLAPKVSGLRNLLQSLKQQPLKFAVAFSSVSATVPALGAGNADYAMANAGMDRLAQAHQAAGGVPLLSLQWPNWKEAGMGETRTAAYRDSGLLAHSNQEGLSLLDQLLQAGARGVWMPVVADAAAWAPERLMRVQAPVQVQAPVPMQPQLPQAAPAVAATAAQDLGAATITWLNQLLADALKMDASRLEADKLFLEYGADSVLLMQMLRRMGKAIGQALDPSLLFQHPSVETLAAWLVANHAQVLGRTLGQALGQTPTAVPAIHTQAAALVEATPQAAMPVAAPIAAPAAATAPAVITAAASRDDHDIAVVGLSCRLPGAADIASYWSVLSEGRSAIAPVPATRWGRDTAFVAGLIDNPSCFDPAAFRLAEADARAMDPQALLLLEESLKVCCDAGYRIDELRGRAVGVYLGARSRAQAAAELVEQAQNPVMVMGANYLAANISRYLDVRGPSLVLDTACSSALVAMNLAVQALRDGEVEAALVGAASLLESDAALRMFEQRGLLSREFHLFDRRAGGVVLGEGAGMVMLKTVAQALRDGDRIQAVIKGLAVNNDGRTASPVAPNFQTQKEVMARALQRSGLRAEDITHIEVNGSGSEVTDLLELKAIEAVYRQASTQACSLGSMKPHIGHPLCAEGIASFIKVVLMLGHQRQLPFLSGQEPMQHYDLGASPFRLLREAAPWTGAPRCAGINAFGDGGTNAHVIVQGWDAAEHTVARQPVAVPPLKRIDLRQGALLDGSRAIEQAQRSSKLSLQAWAPVATPATSPATSAATSASTSEALSAETPSTTPGGPAAADALWRFSAQPSSALEPADKDTALWSW